MRGKEAQPLTDQRYWDAIWRRSASSPGLMRPGDRRLVESLMPLIGLGSGRALIEVGCGNSRWLPYFARHGGFAVTGIDYTASGCQSARGQLEQYGVSGLILQRDLFAPNEDLVGQFDVAVSLGLVEHFADTAAAVASIVRLVHRGGIVVTEVPNMRGLPGLAQRMIGPTISKSHLPLAPAQLLTAYKRAGLTAHYVGYAGTFDPCVINESELPDASRRLFNGVRRIVTLAADAALKMVRQRIESPLLSPYLLIAGTVIDRTSKENCE